MYLRPEIAYSFIELNKAVMNNKGNVTSELKRMIGFIRVIRSNNCQDVTIVRHTLFEPQKDMEQVRKK